MDGRVEGLEVTGSDHSDPALRHAKVAEARLPEQRPARAEVAAPQNRMRLGDKPQPVRGNRVALAVGCAARQPDVTDTTSITMNCPL